jgi:N-acetyl-D-muramate 6-phosphate phosphatase
VSASSSHASRLHAVLFDLDGTLLDTAPDMVGSLVALQAEQGDPPIKYEIGRAYVSNGTTGLLRIAFGTIDDSRHERLHKRFIEIYAGRLALETRLFPGMECVLGHLEESGTPWGVVTNKPSALTDPLLRTLDLHRRCACVVSGDTVAQRKPHPDPLLYALSQIGSGKSRHPGDAGETVSRTSVYVGDARRDVMAGRAAGMRTVAATYGYIPPEENPDTWGADTLVSDPAGLLRVLEYFGG